MRLSRLFEPCRLGSLELKNRLIMPPCTTNFCEDGFVTDGMKHYYGAIARGGVGMLVVEDAIIDSSVGRHTAMDLYIDDDRYIAGLAQLANRIKANGARAAIHLNHGGRRAGRVVNGRLAYTEGRIPVAPSSLAHFEAGFVVPRELTIDEIEELIDKYAVAALRAKEAGFEVVGLHCSHAYLINQFLSPACNKRQDQYGGDLDGRMRFLLRVIEETQRRVGEDFPLFCRISGDEPWEGGLSLKDMKEVAQRLEAAGIQAFVLSRGAARVPAATSQFASSIAPMRIPRGCLVYLAEGIKEAVGVPVATANRINDPVLAEQILEEGKADLIGIGRGLIADPEFPNKAREGRFNEIRTCIACMYCSQQLALNEKLACAVNAQVGREVPPDLSKVASPKKVLVVGGGPAGMEAARVAASRGHEVHVYEGGSQLGGQLLAASVPPGKQEIDELTRYLRTEMDRLGVNVKTGTPVSLTDLERISPDVIIMATGAKPTLPTHIPGLDQAHVATAIEVLQEVKKVAGQVVILGAGQVGAEVAEFLASKGRDVTLISRRGLDQVAIDAPGIMRTLLLLSLKEHGVEIITRAEVKEVTRSEVVYTKRGEEHRIPAEGVVVARGGEPYRPLEGQLQKWPVLWVGDCVTPRNILEAIREGFEAGALID